MKIVFLATKTILFIIVGICWAVVILEQFVGTPRINELLKKTHVPFTSGKILIIGLVFLALTIIVLFVEEKYFKK